MDNVETLLEDVDKLDHRIRAVCSDHFCAAVQLALLRHDPCLPHATKAGVAAPDDLARFGKHILDLYFEWQETD